MEWFVYILLVATLTVYAAIRGQQWGLVLLVSLFLTPIAGAIAVVIDGAVADRKRRKAEEQRMRDLQLQLAWQARKSSGQPPSSSPPLPPAHSPNWVCGSCGRRNFPSSGMPLPPIGKRLCVACGARE